MRTPASLAVALSLTATLHAQPLSDHVPEDALLYIGWQGVDAMPGYAGSHLQGVSQAVNVEQLLRETLPAMLAAQAAQSGDEGARHVAEFVRDMGPVLWSRPGAVYASAFRRAEGGGGGPQPTFGLVLDAGPHKDAARAWMQRLVDQTQNQPGPKLQLTEDGGVLALRAGAAVGEIGDDAAFAEAMKRLRVEPSAIFYLDLAGIYDEIDLMMNEQADDAGLDRWQSWVDAVGFDRVEQVVFAGGIEGADWRTEFHLESEDINGTMLRFLAGPPIGEAELRLVPRTADWVMVQRIDLAALLADVKKAAALMSPPGGGLDNMLEQARAQFGVDLEADVVKPLGDTWAIYSEPAVAGPMGIGVVAINPLRDAAKVQASLATLEGKLNEALAAQGQPLQFTTVDMNGTTVHTIATPVVAPSWAVKDGRLYVGLFPQAIMTADLYTRQANASLLQNEKFQAVVQRLGGRAYNGVMFADLPLTAPPIYGLYQSGLGMMAAMAPGAAVLQLPPLAAIQPHLAPAATISWSDAAGLHSDALSPFPGSTLLSQQAMISSPGMTWPVIAGMAGTRAVHQQQPTASMSNLKQIGLGVMVYAQAHGGALPPDLSSLVAESFNHQLSPLVHPTAGVAVPNAEGMTPEATREWLRVNGSYVYVKPAEKVSEIPTPATTVLAFEKPAFAEGGLVAVLYADGRVERRPLEAAGQQVAQQTGKTLDELVAASAADDATP